MSLHRDVPSKDELVALGPGPGPAAPSGPTPDPAE